MWWHRQRKLKLVAIGYLVMLVFLVGRFLMRTVAWRFFGVAPTLLFIVI
jgi:hypothetical protein